METHQKISMPNYQKLKTMVKRSIDQKLLRLRNFDARNGRIETGAVVKHRKGMSGVEGGKGTCYQWKEKGQCSKGDRCSFRHESNDRVQKPDHNAASPSEPSGSVSRKRSIRGKSNHGAILRQPCRYYLKGTCTQSPCEYWHPPVNLTKQKRAAKPGISVCSRVIRLMNNQTKSRRMVIVPTKEESDDKNAVAIVKIVPQLGCVSQDSDALVSQRRKQPRRNPMQKVLGSIRRVRFTQSTLRQASIREKKGPSLGNIQVKNPHQRSPYAMKFEDQSHEETGRQQRCARSKAWNLARNTHKLEQKERATFYSPSEEWVMPAASTIKSEERGFVVHSGASMHMVSRKDLTSGELETVRTSRSPTTAMTANGEVRTREEATVYVRELDLFVTVMLLEETPAVLSLGKLCEDHGYSYHWTIGQKPHLTPNGKRIDCNVSNYVPFVVPG